MSLELTDVRWLVSIGSGNSLVPPRKNPLPEPMVTKLYVAPYATTRSQFS